MVTKGNRVDKEVRDMTFFGQSIWFLLFKKKSGICYRPGNLYLLESIWDFSCNLCIVCVRQCERKETGPRDKHVAWGVPETNYFFHLVFAEFTRSYTHWCLWDTDFSLWKKKNSKFQKILQKLLLVCLGTQIVQLWWNDPHCIPLDAASFPNCLSSTRQAVIDAGLWNIHLAFEIILDGKTKKETTGKSI